MLPAGSATCSTTNGVFFCMPKTPAALDAYEALQDRVRIVVSTMAQAGRQVPQGLTTLISDGRIGPTTAIGVQLVLAVLATVASTPTALAPVLDPTAAPDALIATIAANADDALAYIDATLMTYPDVVKQPTQTQIVTQVLKQTLLTKQNVIAGLVGLGAVGGMGMLLYGLHKRRDGRHDSSGMLPPDDRKDVDEGDDAEA